MSRTCDIICAVDHIHQAFSLCFCTLQTIKSWRRERPGNEARIQRGLKMFKLQLTLHSITGHLPSPENTYVAESTIGWKPPYSSMNNSFIRVHSDITQYTVYITDNYTGNSISKQNVTETQYIINNQDDRLCLMYQVSAWNAGGEGELSEPVQESIPRSNLVI